MKIYFTNRLFAPFLAKPNVDYSVQSFSKSAIGGPNRAEIKATGSVNDLFELIEYLRYAVEIYDDSGRACWWGYINEVQINTGKIRFGVSLETMYNKVAVYFGAGHNTATASDTDSQAEYGKRTGRFTLTIDNETQANYARDGILARRKYPVPEISMDDSEPGAVLYCKGWWHITDWGTYVQPVTGMQDTASQIQAMMANSVWPNVYVDTATGLSGVQAQKQRTAGPSMMDYVKELLLGGTSNGKRMLINVDVLRDAHIVEEPASSNDDYWIDSKGNIKNYIGMTLPKQLVEAGRWLRLQDVVPATADVSKLSDPSKVFLEEVEYLADSDALRITPRDVPLDFDIFKYGV